MNGLGPVGIGLAIAFWIVVIGGYQIWKKRRVRPGTAREEKSPPQ